MKRFMGWILCLALVCAAVCAVPARAAGYIDMPSFFADDMLFEQNKPMNIWGTGSAGTRVQAQLLTAKGDLLEQVETTVTDGGWQVSLAPRAGGYDAYGIRLLADGQEMKYIRNVLVGELWLASGQSNMEFRLDWAVGGREALDAADDPYFRVLMMPGDPYGTGGNHPTRPAEDIRGCWWATGQDSYDLAGMSAMAYFMAQKLRADLNVPVGVINTALGATKIQTWLTRESIENSPAVKAALQRSNLYFTEAQMDEMLADYQCMTAMFNSKVGPLAGMNLAGMVWCQGEGNRESPPSNDGFYTAALLALARGYSRVFGFANGDMPLLAVHIANHPYRGDAWNIAKWIEEVDDAVAQNPHIYHVPLYDVPLTYQSPPSPSAAYAIHPNHKREPGERAAVVALNNLYRHNECLAPRVRSFTQDGDSLLVRFDHVGRGLATLSGGRGVRGFTVAGDDKTYAPAYARIESADTVRVWNDGVAAPTRFTYAFVSYAQSADLCNSYGIPAVPYRANRQDKLMTANEWLLCDDDTVFIDDGMYGAFEPTWHAAGDNATVTIDRNDVFDGTGAVRFAYPAGGGAAAAEYGYSLMDLRITRYACISLMLKNDDDRPKTVRLLLGSREKETRWMLAAAGAEESFAVTLPAHSPYTRYSFVTATVKGYNTEERPSLLAANHLEVLVEDAAAGNVLIDSVTLGTHVPEKPVSSLEPVVPVPSRVRFGDVNEDGDVNAADALRVLLHAVGKRLLTDNAFLAADVDGSGGLDAKDALLILKKAVGKIDAFPVEAV